MSDAQTGFLAALPFVFGGIGMVLLGRHSDRTMERKGHVAVALLMAAVGIGLSGLVSIRSSSWRYFALRRLASLRFPLCFGRCQRAF